MTELLTAAQMRAIEQAAITSGKVTGLELMERAGRGVVTAIFHAWPGLAPSWGPAPKPPEYLLQDDERGKHRAVILCGPGNNGGDGFVVARLLRDAGWQVDVFLYGDPEKLPPDAKVNYDRYADSGHVSGFRNNPPPFQDDSLSIPGQIDVLVDATFGTGLSRPFGGVFAIFAGARELMSRRGVRCVAVDVPSGLCADSGRVLGTAIPADLTVTFHAAKCGHYLGKGPQLCGRLVLVDIGISREPAGDAVTVLYAPAGFVGKGQGHKYTHGHALVLSGGVGKGGAARMAARSALRVGAGAVTLGCPPAALIENAAQLNAVMLGRVRDVDDLATVLVDRRINALCLGPGLGTDEREAALVAAVLGGDNPRPTILDADALTLLAQDAALFDRLHDRCVLTPHAGEFTRLFPDIAEKLDAPADKGPAYSKVDATRDAAMRAGCVVLFKGPDTVIADPAGRCSINASVYERSAPWLATAGSGDVLAGFIAGLLARGFTPMQAAEIAAWLHTEAALEFGPGLIAEDLPDVLPAVFRNMGL